ncbi:GTPase-associated system all-helical protein GASH [Stenotrophomonas sp.]|uniref:GTPase-associated system all-helical protein GASH n=1 Tax=Stenotrophomonas sp. TaxID=69392 RepID=UPI0028B197AE|nr:GTPase-associated system all-helical protein GASH [Stenotrophomonas sp.]
MEEFLMRFLDIGAFNLNSDDTKLEKLRAAVRDLAGALQKTPAKTASFTMVAADPSVPSSDPVLDEAMAVVRKHWETVSNAFTGRPVAVLRAVLLDAIVQAARRDDAIAVAFVNAARNALAHSETADEAPIWRDAISEIETKVDARAEAEWATPEMISVEPLIYAPPAPGKVEFEPPVVDRPALQRKIHSAAGPWGEEDSNPHQSSNPHPWSKEFADRMSVAISETMDTIAEELAPAPLDLSAPLTSLAKAVTAHVEAALASFSSATAGLQRRTHLLWWKEALYSPSAHESYLEMPAFQASALMALDLHEQVPTFSPASVSAFLKEAIRCLPMEPGTEGGGRRDIASLVHEAKTSAFMQPFRALATQYVPAPVGRGPLLALIGHALDDATTEAATLRALGGVDASSSMTPGEWGTYLFRELQAARATSVKSGTRAKKR